MTAKLPSVHPAPLPTLGMDDETLLRDFRHYFCRALGRDRIDTSTRQLYEALSLALRDRVMERWNATRHAYETAQCRRTCYLSLEYLMGRTLGNALLNLGLVDSAREAMDQLGLDLEAIEELEHDAGLGNGGLGRLAACFLDSCATLQLPVIGYGIRYSYGMFRQRIDAQGRQIEEPDAWLRHGNPWEIERAEHTQTVHYGGRSEAWRDEQGRLRMRWIDTETVLAVPYDVPIPGYRNGTVNTLRLWAARANDAFNLSAFNAGSYPEAVAAQNAAANITMVLYPNDASENGRELRLRQQYFLASASLRDVLRQWTLRHGNHFENFAAQHCFQLNDTHPTLAIAELMRLLLDEHHLGWDQAWDITTGTMAYTNHTLLPEALERWPLPLMRRLLPRLLEIILEINARFLHQVAMRWPGDSERLRRMSIIEEGDVQQVRMAYLAIVASFSVNGVAELHSRLLRQGLFHDFSQLWPHKFNNKTNGVTQRRWLGGCNPELSNLISAHIGTGWITDLAQLAQLAPLADEPALQQGWQAVRAAARQRLCNAIAKQCGIEVPPTMLFDVQVKRIHEYKRQLLNVLRVIHLYDCIKRGETAGLAPRCVLIGGKAAPGYAMAKLIVRLINAVAQEINGDADVAPWLQLVFYPNYGVSAMELICPAADLSEQISTAGKEASGTGNMKFMMNGAITIGTLDGANIEIRREVGAENFFLFGLDAREVAEQRRDYRPGVLIEADDRLHRVMQLLESGHFNRHCAGLFEPIIQSIRSPHDPWMTAADFGSYLDAQNAVDLAWHDATRWARMSILNTAHSGFFSTDRSIRDYNRDIWKLKPIPALSVS